MVGRLLGTCLFQLADTQPSSSTDEHVVEASPANAAASDLEQPSTGPTPTHVEHLGQEEAAASTSACPLPACTTAAHTPSTSSPAGIPALPSRPKPKSVSFDPPARPAGGLPFDPLGRNRGGPAPRSHGLGPGHPPAASKPAHERRPLPQHVQNLSDDLLRMIEEAGIGERTPIVLRSSEPALAPMPSPHRPALPPMPSPRRSAPPPPLASDTGAAVS